MADTEIAVSKVKAKNAYGQNGFQGASSLSPGQTKRPTADVSPPVVTVPGVAPADQISARVHATPIKTHDGFRRK